MSSFDEVWGRIKEVTPLKTLTDLANAMGIKQSGVSKIKKRNEFRPKWILVLAEEYGFSSDWAWTGKGSAHGNGSTEENPSSELDIDLLQAAIEAIEEVLESSNRQMASDKKAQLVAAVYDLYSDTEKEVDRGGILRLIKAAA